MRVEQHRFWQYVALVDAAIVMAIVAGFIAIDRRPSMNYGCEKAR